MTTWREYNEARPLRGDAARAYERERAGMGVGYLILNARSAAGLTQAGLARKIRSTQPMIARWESGAQVPNLNTMMKIAEATGFDLTLGLHDRRAPAGRFAALAYLEASGKTATLHVVREESPTYRVASPARPRRRKAAAHHRKPRRR